MAIAKHSHVHDDRAHGEHRRGHDHHEDHPHRRGDDHGHGHTHGVVDPSIVSTERGMWAVKVSFAVMITTAAAQLVVVYLTSSAALLADTIHNFGDALTAVPLGIAFLLARRAANPRFNYGFGRAEDVAGFIIVLTILGSAVAAGFTSIDRLFHPAEVFHLEALATAAVIGFLGNEAVAVFRIRVGKEIGSAALVADGHHARADGFTSLGVLAAAAGVWLGYPMADPIAGLVISAAIFVLVWQSAKSVITRMMDGVDAGTVEGLKHAATHVEGVRAVNEVRARWVGHRLRVEMNVSVDGALPVSHAHELAAEVRHQVFHHNAQVSDVMIHLDPPDRAGEAYHKVAPHSHDGLPEHSH